MSRMNRAAYQQMIDENLAWLETCPRTLERDHVIAIVKASPDHEYGAAADKMIDGAALASALRKVLPADLLEQVIDHCDPLRPFLRVLREEAGGP